jgi:hypothetical protein
MSEVGPEFIATQAKKARSKVTNHTNLLPDLDGRSALARRFRDLVSAYIADMGGIDNCSEVKIGLLRRLAAASVLAEAIEAKAMNGVDIDLSEFCNLASTTVRLSSRVGIERKPRDVTPSLHEYLDVEREESVP